MKCCFYTVPQESLKLYNSNSGRWSPSHICVVQLLPFILFVLNSPGDSVTWYYKLCKHMTVMQYLNSCHIAVFGKYFLTGMNYRKPSPKYRITKNKGYLHVSLFRAEIWIVFLQNFVKLLPDARTQLYL